MPIISKEFTVKLVITSRCLFCCFIEKSGFYVNIWQLRALKSPQKFRTPGCSSANFFGSWYISDLKSKFYYEILTFCCHFKIKLNSLAIESHFFFMLVKSALSGCVCAWRNCYRLLRTRSWPTSCQNRRSREPSFLILSHVKSTVESGR